MYTARPTKGPPRAGATGKRRYPPSSHSASMQFGDATWIKNQNIVGQRAVLCQVTAIKGVLLPGAMHLSLDSWTQGERHNHAITHLDGAQPHV